MLKVADAAYPFDYSILPADVVALFGYAGGSTPHAWTAAEVRAVGEAGLAWRAIWTVPQRALDVLDGDTAAAGMIAALQDLGYPLGLSVFLDVEYWAYWANPDGATACANAWAHRMGLAGWPQAYWYGPVGSPCDWLAHWTGTEPAELPAGVVGVQYDHALSGDRYDLSVFVADLFAREGTAAMPLDPNDPNDAKVIAAANPDQTHPDTVCLGSVYHQVFALMSDPTHDSVRMVRSDLVKLSAKLTDLADAVTHLTALVGGLVPGGTPVPAGFEFTGTGQITPVA